MYLLPPRGIKMEPITSTPLFILLMPRTVFRDVYIGHTLPKSPSLSWHRHHSDAEIEAVRRGQLQLSCTKSSNQMAHLPTNSVSLLLRWMNGPCLYLKLTIPHCTGPHLLSTRKTLFLHSILLSPVPPSFPLYPGSIPVIYKPIVIPPNFTKGKYTADLLFSSSNCQSLFVFKS